MPNPPFPEVTPPDRLLLGPGPSMTEPRVLQAMGHASIGHLDPYLLQLYAQEQEMLRSLFQTRNEWTFALSGTGTSGMEAALANLIVPGDPVLVAIHGYFGGRLAEIASRLGAQVDRLERPWGEIFPVEQVEAALMKKKYKLLAVVQAETSTGAWQLHVDDLAAAAHRTGALLVLDTVTSLGGLPVEIDTWDVDVAYSASQKCLSAPSGLAPITVSARAREAIAKRPVPVASFYLDLKAYADYWGGAHGYHHTASASLHYALHTALRLALEEGLPTRFERHQKNAALLWQGLEDLDLPPLIPPAYRLPMLATPRLPEGIDEAALRKRLLDEQGNEIAGGLGTLKGKVWRIGLMGHSSQPGNVARLLDAIRRLFG